MVLIQLLHYLLIIYTFLLEFFPTLKKIFISSIPESGDKNNVRNYRSITQL